MSVPNLRQAFRGLVGQAHDDRVLELVRAGQFVPWPMLRVPAGSLASFEAAQDYFALLDDEQGFVRWPLSAPCAQRVADELGLMLPTPKMVDLICNVAEVRVDPMPWGPPYDASMLSVDRFLEHNKRIESGYAGLVGRHGRQGLLAGAKKDVVITARLADSPMMRGPFIYGWHRRNNLPIQPLSGAHRKETFYADYSHGVRFCAKRLRLNEVDVPLEEALARPDRAPLLSGEGALSYACMRYTVSPAAPPKPPSPLRAVSTPTQPTVFAPGPVTEPSPPPWPFVQARNYTKGRKVPVDLIVIHTMETPEKPVAAESVAGWFAGPNAPAASAHFCVDGDSIVQCVKIGDVAWHAPGANHNGVGIEHAGYARQTVVDWADEYSHAMLCLSAELVAHLCTELHIPAVYVDAAGLSAGKRGITTHDAVSKAFKKSSHYDPGPHFPMQQYLEMVRDAMRVDDSYA